MLTAEQAAERLELVTASEAAGVIGISRYHSAHATYRRLVHGEVVELEGEDLDRGNFLEDGCIRWFEKKTGTQCERIAEHLRHPKHPFIGVLPDAIAYELSPDTGVTYGVEVKNPGPFAPDWGDPGTDQVPPDAFIQSVVGMACTGLNRWDVVAPLGGRLCIYPIERNFKIEEEVIGRLVTFWEQSVVPKVPPALSFPDADHDWVHRRWKFDRGDYLQAEECSEATMRTLDLLEQAQRELRTWEDTREACANRLKEVIGNKSGIMLGERGRIDWKLNKPKEVVDWQGVARELGALLGASVGTIIQPHVLDFDGLAAAHTLYVEGLRPFTPRFRK